MLVKSYSQIIARVFEIVNYFMAPIPVALGVFLLYLAPYFFLVVLLLWMACAPGLWLAAQYFKHSRGDLDEEKISVMWIATIVFNGLFLFVNVGLIYPNYGGSADRSLYPRTVNAIEVIWIILVIWWILAILLSVIALLSKDRRKKGSFEYRRHIS